AGAGDVRVLGRPYRLEAALFERPAELGRSHRVIGEKHRRAKIHLFLHRSDRPSLRSIDESSPESRGIRAPATSGHNHKLSLLLHAPPSAAILQQNLPA